MQTLSASSALILASCCLLLAASVTDAMPQARRRTAAKSQRQVELVASTPYPAAGFRPSIPFDLPSERQPKLEQPLEDTTTSTVVEDFSTTDAQSTTEVEQEQQTEQQQQQEVEEEQEEEQLAEVEANARTPANTYGAPNPVEDTIEVVAQAPSQDFQPPVREAVEDFAAVAIDGPADEQQPVADLPALDQAGLEQEVTLKATATTPASTYGAPKTNTPARSYGAPELEEPDNELEVEESQVELFEEDEEQQQQRELSEAAATLGLNNGRLILLPLNAGGAQFGRLILAVEQPKPRHSQRSERLRRRN